LLRAGVGVAARSGFKKRETDVAEELIASADRACGLDNRVYRRQKIGNWLIAPLLQKQRHDAAKNRT